MPPIPPQDEAAHILSAIMESIVDGIVVIDARGRIEAFNPAAERMFGYTASEVMGQNVSLLMPSPYREEHDGYLASYMATGVQKIIGIGRDVSGRRRDGTAFPVHLSVGEMSLGGERKFTGIVHDLSSREVMEQRLRDQAALARLGEMAAVIAHEVKNPLAGVRGAIEIIAGRLVLGDSDRAVVKEMISRLDDLNELMQDLLLFARPPSPRLAPVDLRSLVATTADILSSDPAMTAISVDITGAPPPVLADAGLLKIVFLNVMMNGAHAMEGRGRIGVSLEDAAGPCRIAFHDAGPGIAPDVRDQIFTPFFTTKARGTGLGLPTAKRLIEAHNGSIRVECPPAGGTTVIVELPARS